MKSTASWLASAERHLYPNYNKPALIFDRGEGSRIWDTEGRCYLDLYAGVAVNVLGHSHPAMVQAIQEQAARLLHVANYYHTVPNIELAEKLCQLTQMDRAFFCNSGTEANEALLKLARRYFYEKGQKERYQILAFDGSFHGRTLGALTATGQPKYREGFGPTSGVIHVPYGDLDAVRRALGPQVAGILFEPILGEAGVIPAPEGFLTGLRALADETGCLLLADEIQTGVGRTGRFLALEHVGVQADAVALAKGLGGGFPIGALVCKEHLSHVLQPGTHGTTYGGGPLASATSLAILRTLEQEGLCQRAERVGQILQKRLQEIAARHPEKIAEARGVGMLAALGLKPGVDLGAHLAAFREAGVLLIPAGHSIRFCPALTIGEEELEEGLQIVDRVLGELS